MKNRTHAKGRSIIITILMMLSMTIGWVHSTSGLVANADSLAGESVQEAILSVEDATLQMYSYEDIIATLRFLLNEPYDGCGRVIDFDEDGHVNAKDLTLLKRHYKEKGNYHILLTKLINGSGADCATTLSTGEELTNRVVVRAAYEMDFSSYNPVAILSDNEYKYILQFDSTEAANACVFDLQNKDGIIYAELDEIETLPIDESTEDTSVNSIESVMAVNSWGVSAIEADKFSEYLHQNFNNHITVAVVDTGVSNHSFLSGRILSGGRDFANGDNDPTDDHGHGTHVAGTVVDCTPNLNIDILPIKVLAAKWKYDLLNFEWVVRGEGSGSQVAAGIDYAVAMGADVINLSLGGPHSQQKDEAIQKAIKAGVTVVVAAGNDNKDTSGTCPAHISDAIVVSAVDSSLNKAYFSNYGSSVDVAAPGVYIKSCVPNNIIMPNGKRLYSGDYVEMSGTSMATPHISAVAAMIKYAGIATTPAQINSTLISTCKDLGASGFDVYYGNGIPQLSKLVKNTVNPTITLTAHSKTIYTGEKFTLSASVNPGDVDVKWNTSNANVATVSNGTVTAKGNGTATITAFFSYNNKTYSDTCTVTVKTPGISVSDTSRNVYQTNSFTLTATTSPGGQSVTWSSSDSNVATVSGGKVTAVNPGTAKITASMIYGGVSYSASCTVTVNPVSIKLSESSKTVYQTDTFTLSATVSPSGQTVSWKSSDSNVATVSNGKVTAVGSGSATITASFAYGGKTFSASCSVTVKKVSVSISKKTLELIVGNNTTVSATSAPSGLTVSWNSSNVMVASVSNGKITANAPGKVTITASITYNGTKFSDTCEVTSSEPYVDLSLSQIKIAKGDTTTIKATTYPANQTVSWKSANTKICTVDSNGKITAVATGNTTVTASMTYAGTVYSRDCIVIVGVPKVTISPTSLSIYEGGSDYLVASVIAVDDSSFDATTDVTWKSSNTSIATVNNGGKVTGVKAGSATITATYSFAGENYSATSSVTILERPNITISKSSLSLYIGDVTTLSATVSPTGQTVSWSSSNTGVAKVSSGKVTAISNGTATITASFQFNGVTYSDTCSVTVSKPSITFDVTNKSLWIGDEFVIYETVKPSGQKVSWTSSNTSVATVTSNGTVTATGSGSATITGAFTYGGNKYSATCTVKVATPTVTLSSYSGSGTQNVWDIVSLTSGKMGYCVDLPSATASPSGCSIDWQIESGPAVVLSGDKEMCILQPKEKGVVKAVATITYKGRTYKSSPYVYNLSLYKNCTELNYFYKISNAPLHSTDNRYPFNIPKGTVVDITEIVVNGDANTQGSTVYGKTTYNGETGWIIITYVP